LTEVFAQRRVDSSLIRKSRRDIVSETDNPQTFTRTRRVLSAAVIAQLDRVAWNESNCFSFRSACDSLAALVFPDLPQKRK
jgi:hypothetical protein